MIYNGGDDEHEDAAAWWWYKDDDDADEYDNGDGEDATFFSMHTYI